MTATIKGTSMPKSELNAYAVGLLRIAEAQIANSNYNRGDIEIIGRCSINRREVAIGKIGNFWCVRGRTLEFELRVQSQYGQNARFRAYYIVKGKRVTALHPGTNRNMAEFECRDTSKPIYMMDAEELFYAAKGKRPSRKCGTKISFSTKLANGIRMEKR